MQTDAGPWREGANTLKVCAVDFGGLDGCTEATVNVDNSCDDSTGTTVGPISTLGLPAETRTHVSMRS